MDRRNALRTLAALPLLGISGRLLALGPTQPKLLVVFLRGAYDAASLLVPTSSSFYYESRPNIAIPRPADSLDSALPLTADWGLHPALRESIAPMFARGEAAFIPFAGTDDLSRSHFETQDSIELGQALNGSRAYDSGFLNRLVSVVRGKAPIAFTEQLPLILRGSTTVPNIALRGAGKTALDERQSRIIADMYRDTPLAAQVSEGFAVKADVSRELAGEMQAASRQAVSAKGFELQAQRIARLMREQYSVGFVDVGGWDTHVAQGASSGYLANRLDEFGRGLAAFADGMGDRWRDSVVVVISEFGRTFRENGNRGTDHGHGTVYWVLGGAIRGGRILGEQQAVEARTLFQNRDYPVLNEYRSLFGGLFGRLYGLGPKELAQVFPGARPVDVGIV